MKQILSFIAGVMLVASFAGCEHFKKEYVNERMLYIPEAKANDTTFYTIGWSDFHGLPVTFIVDVPFADSVVAAFSFQSHPRISWSASRPQIVAGQEQSLTVRPTSGSGTGCIYVSVAPNNTPTQRTDRFTLLLEEHDSISGKVIGAMEHTFVFNQK